MGVLLSKRVNKFTVCFNRCRCHLTINMCVKSSCTFVFYCLYFKLLFYYSIWYSKQTCKMRHGDAISKKQSRVPTAITFVQHCKYLSNFIDESIWKKVLHLSLFVVNELTLNSNKETKKVVIRFMGLLHLLKERKRKGF